MSLNDEQIVSLLDKTSYNAPIADATNTTEQYYPKMYQRGEKGEIKYNYDPNNINYSNMTVQMWNDIPSDPSPYSHYWENQDQFGPQQFSRNQQSPKSWNDLPFLVLFWINFAITVILAIISICKASDKIKTKFHLETNSDDLFDTQITKGKFILYVVIALGISIAVNAGHFCFATFAPYVYVKLGLFIGLAIVVVTTLIMSFFTTFWCMLVVLLFFIIAIIAYCIMKDYITMSASILKQSCALIRRNPSVLLLCLFQSVLEVIINIVFGAFIFSVEFIGWSAWTYVYIVFSYYWTTVTFGYVVYMTGAGFAASWYFLNGTGFMPSSPVWSSYKRAMTTSFGSAACAGFLIAIIEALKHIVESDNNNNGNDNGCTAMCVLKCIAMCILNCLEAFVSWMSHYGLIYCAIYGVPYSEGCRRWAEISCKKFANVLISGCVISNVVSYNLFTFGVVACFIGYCVGLIFGKAAAIICCVFTCIFTFSIFILLEQPLYTISDTLLICFSEAPEKLHTSANELYQTLCNLYQISLQRKLH